MDYPEEFKREIEEAIQDLISQGLVEVVGFDANGEFLYQLTEKGHQRFEDAEALYNQYERRSALFNIDPASLN